MTKDDTATNWSAQDEIASLRQQLKGVESMMQAAFMDGFHHCMKRGISIAVGQVAEGIRKQRDKLGYPPELVDEFADMMDAEIPKAFAKLADEANARVRKQEVQRAS